MGVDYDANFGIGIELQKMCFDDNEEWDMDEYLEDLLEDTPYTYSKYGSENYTGKENTYLILFKDPFADGYNITKKVFDMKKFLKKNKIKFEKIDIVGGLLIW